MTEGQKKKINHNQPAVNHDGGTFVSRSESCSAKKKAAEWIGIAYESYVHVHCWGYIKQRVTTGGTVKTREQNDYRKELRQNQCMYAGRQAGRHLLDLLAGGILGAGHLALQLLLLQLSEAAAQQTTSGINQREIYQRDSRAAQK